MPAERITKKSIENNQNVSVSKNTRTQASRKATSILIAFLLSVMIVVTFCMPLNNAFANENTANNNASSITTTTTTQNVGHDAQLATICNPPLVTSPISGNAVVAYAIIACCGVCVLSSITNAVLDTKLKKVSKRK